MNIYKIDENKINKLSKRNLLVFILSVTLSIVFGFGIAILKNGKHIYASSYIIIFGIILSVVTAAILIIVTNKFKNNYLNFNIQIDNDLLIINRNKSQIKLNYSDIERIDQFIDNTAYIILKNKNSFQLNKNVSNYDELLLELNTKVPIKKKNKNIRDVFTLFGGILAFILIAVVYLSSVPVIVISAGVILLFTIAIVTFKLIRNTFTDKSVKLSSSMCFILLTWNIIKELIPYLKSI